MVMLEIFLIECFFLLKSHVAEVHSHNAIISGKPEDHNVLV